MHKLGKLEVGGQRCFRHAGVLCVRRWRVRSAVFGPDGSSDGGAGHLCAVSSSNYSAADCSANHSAADCIADERTYERTFDLGAVGSANERTHCGTLCSAGGCSEHSSVNVANSIAYAGSNARSDGGSEHGTIGVSDASSYADPDPRTDCCTEHNAIDVANSVAYAGPNPRSDRCSEHGTIGVSDASTYADPDPRTDCCSEHSAVGVANSVAYAGTDSSTNSSTEHSTVDLGAVVRTYHSAPYCTAYCGAYTRADDCSAVYCANGCAVDIGSFSGTVDLSEYEPLLRADDGFSLGRPFERSECDSEH